ncbi:phage tail protein [Clostridium sp. 19966]|uniref:major tail protein n=1 Tax=Clostridium sp. 19966 TaxID=2768166 RepID=UPI0028DF684D|nr:major tail protein [Clostridium sp. 19966]MDT8717604.1 phage tail protein [Clostridium sp. 19966]
MARRKGLKDIYVAVITKDDATTYTTGTPVLVKKGVTAKISIKKSSEQIKSDDVTEETVDGFESGSIEIEWGDLSPTEKAMLMGYTVQNGFLAESTDDVAKNIAIGFRSKKTDGKYEFSWYYNVKFGQGEDSDYESMGGGDKPKIQSQAIKGDIMGRQKDNRYRIRVDESYLLDTDTDAKAAIADWFSKVQELPSAA